MASLNRVQLIGNLGKDPEQRFLSSGDSVVNFSVACSDSWKDKETGEKKERTEWVNIVMFGKVSEIAHEYLRKGSKAYLEGRLQTRKWQDKEGNDRWSTEVVADKLILLGDKKSDSEPAPKPAAKPAAPAPKPAPKQDDLDDDISF